MPVDESKNWYRDRKLDPKICDKTTYVTKKIKPGVEIVLCKEKKCVKKSGKSGCRLKLQSLRHSKESYKKMPNGTYKRKEL